MTLADAVEEFLELKRSSTAPATAEQYSYALTRRFLPWAAAAGLVDIDQLDDKVLRAWVAELQSDSLRPESVRSYARCVNIFARWLKSEGYAERRAQARLPKARRRLLEILTRDEIDQMEKIARDPRDRLVVRVLADTGIRVGELVNLRLEDLVSEDGHHLLRIRGKTGGRYVGLESKLHRRLQRWVADGRRGTSDRSEPLFTSLRGDQGLTRHGVEQLVRRLGMEAGLQKRVHPHLFRHSYATWWLSTGRDSVMLMRILGHGSRAMIASVYEHLSSSDLAAAMTGALRSAPR